MSDPQVRGVVLAHGDMAVGLVDAVQSIAGIEDGVLVAITNRGMSPQSLADQVRGAVGSGPAIVFTDLPSGSCGFAARLLCRNETGLTVICGVNLPMLLDFVMHREMPREELVERIVAKARASIHAVNATAPRHGNPAVQG